MLVAFAGFSTESSFNYILGLHIPLLFYDTLVANVKMAIVSCQVQTAIVVAVFIIGAYLERKLFSPVEPAPQWVTIRESRLTR